MKTTPNLPFGLFDRSPKNLSKTSAILDVETLRQQLWKERLIVLRGFRTFDTSEGFAGYCDAGEKSASGLSVRCLNSSNDAASCLFQPVVLSIPAKQCIHPLAQVPEDLRKHGLE